MTDDTEEIIRTSGRLVREISRILSGNRQEAQEVTLIDLVATYLTGCPRQYRKEILERMAAAMLEVSEVNEKLRFGEKGHPGNERQH